MIGIILQLALAGQASAQPTPAPQGKATLQQMFDQASQAAEERRCNDAIRQFEALEANPAAMRNPLVTAAIGVRKGGCLINTGRWEEGEAAIRRGLPALTAKGEAFAGDVRDAHLALGRASTARFDYATAAAEYRLALEPAQGVARIRPLMALSQVLAFDKDGEALRYATEARTLALATPGLSKGEVAVVQAQYARVLLNQGQLKEGYAELKDSLKKQGGLTLRVGVADITTRSDLAIAALLNNDRDEARNYLAYTGAGRLKDGPFAKARSMDLPLCGEETGLKRDDFAIVEFSLEEDGHVSGVMPVYTTGGREVAVAFARAVADWSWAPEDAKKVPALFRYTTRVQLRCTVAGERPALTAPLAETYARWMESQGQSDPAWADQPDAKAAPLQRAALDSAKAKGDKAATLAAAFALGSNTVLTEPERVPLLEQAIALADELKAPASVRAYLALEHLRVKSEGPRRFREGLRVLLARPEIAGDPLGAATARLLLATPGYHMPAPADVDQLLGAVIDAPDLPAQHPLKVNALLQRANILAKTGDLAGARSSFERTGLTEEQCAFLGLEPVLRSSGASSGDYPMEAVRMGFEGWVRTEFDIAANGTTIAPRAVIAYPPFVFNDAGTGIVKGARFASSFRPGGGVACTAEQQSVVFRLP